MRRIDFDPSELNGEERAWWERWSARAALATQAALYEVESGRQPNWRSGVWSELKQWLLENVFEGKCAYCEVRFKGNFFGDAEHYRPKGRVTLKENGQIRTVEDGGRPHPGYYWLAYEWRNLLPACELCNSSDGKMNQFPVAVSHIFHHDDGPDIDALDEAEGPLLLHPYRDDPSEHLRFGVKGTVVPRDGSERGQRSIEVYDLGRAALEAERQRSQEEAENGFMLALLKSISDGTSLDEAMERYLGKPAPFSQAVRDYLTDKKNEIVEKLEAAFHRH